jgi:hypothetical protein
MDEKIVTVSYTIWENQKEWLEQEGKRLDRPPSSVLRLILTEWIANHIPGQAKPIRPSSTKS